MSARSWDAVAHKPGEPVRMDLSTTSLADARRLVRDLLDGRDGIRVEDAVQLTDELVSNACRHGEPPHICRLTLLDRGRRLRVEVDDSSPEQPALRAPDRTGGLGLLLIHRLASSWGVQRHPDHKTVLAELELDAPEGTGPATFLKSVVRGTSPS